MSKPLPITVVGGGLAGLTLGIALRQRDVPVTIWEAGRYPRHRVCGEFICGRGRDTIRALGLESVLLDAGAIEAATTAFFAGSSASPVHLLPDRALCLSRFALDSALAVQFSRLGGELHDGVRWTEPGPDEGVVKATGRRAQTQPGGWHWFGLKAHTLRAELTADLELHFTPNGYVGLCRLSGGIVNVCGLFRRRHATPSTPPPKEMLMGSTGSALYARLANCEIAADSVCAVGGLDLRPNPHRDSRECRIGDALTMIPPFTGNGMSMAMEAAAVAAGPLEQWSRGETSWAATRQSIARRCDEVFGRRLAWAGWLHQLMFISPLQPAMVRWLPRSQWSWNLLFSRTH
jgi:flavin-dependent dehydrogenase